MSLSTADTHARTVLDLGRNCLSGDLVACCELEWLTYIVLWLIERSSCFVPVFNLLTCTNYKLLHVQVSTPVSSGLGFHKIIIHFFQQIALSPSQRHVFVGLNPHNL